MRRKDIFRMCLNNLKRRKARTFLTVLGVLIGCCSIVIMISIGIGMKEQQEQMLAEMGDLTIISVSPPQGGKGKTKLDAQAIEKMKKIQGVLALSPRISLDNYTATLTAGMNGRYVCDWSEIVGLDLTALPNLGYALKKGELPHTDDTNVLVGEYLAYDFRDTFRPEGSNTVSRYDMYDDQGNITELPDPYFQIDEGPIVLEITGDDNKKVKIELTPVGIMKEDYAKGMETGDGIVLGINTLQKLIGELNTSTVAKKNYESVSVKVTDISMVSSVEQKIKKLGFNTSSMESIRKPMEKEAHQKQLMLGGLGAISLFVAALGITNTMIMSISERTKEIGIMKALGCYVKDIRMLFLMEAGAIGFLGGVVGCVLSALISLIMNIVSAGGLQPGVIQNAILGGNIARMSIIPAWLYAFALVFSVGIGVGSGYYPANKAVQISALEAIKSSEA